MPNVNEGPDAPSFEELVNMPREEFDGLRNRPPAPSDEFRALQHAVRVRTKQYGKSEEALQELAGELLGRAAGLDLTTPHGRDTPRRFVNMLRELTTPEEFKFTTFPAESQNMVMLKAIPFSSVCSHHVIPFVGYAHIAYVPNERIAGLSKFARLIKAASRSLQVQESLTMQIADGIEHHLEPLGVAVVMDAEHLCMTIRGAQSPGTQTRTAEMRGVFANHEKTAKTEFLQFISGQ